MQVVYNIFDQAPEDELLPYCQAHGIAVIARVPFDEGSLTGTLTPESRWPDGDWRNIYFNREHLTATLARVDRLSPLVPEGMDLPELALRFILEHLSSKDGVDFVRSAAPQVGGTITPYHMILTRTDWLGWGLKPYMYCMPVIKTAKDRTALRKAATSGESCYFLGTDSAPHPMAKKLALNGIPGLFNAPVAIETYAKVFEEEGALDKLEAFASLNGPKHYRLPPNEERITLEKTSWTAPEEVEVEGPDEKALVYRGGEAIEWKVVAS